MDIGDRIRAARKAAGLTQEEVARAAGLTLKGMGDIERGTRPDPHISSLRQIAHALGVPVETLVKEKPVAAGKAEAPEVGRDEDVPAWVTAWLRPDWQSAGEALDEICREWAELQQKGELNLDKIERIFEEVARWSRVVEPGLVAEVRQLIETRQVRVDPNIDPNNLHSAEFLGLLGRLFGTGKLASAWSRWLDLQDAFLAEAEALELINPKMRERRERIEKVAEVSSARTPILNALERGRAGAA